MSNNYEAKFPDDLAYIARGGREFKTIITEQENGFEQRNQNITSTRAQWVISGGLLTKDTVGPLGIFNLLNFHNAMRGRLYGFRFKDFQDFKATKNEGILGNGFGSGYQVYRLAKRYLVGDLKNGISYTQQIKKPVQGTLRVYKNNNELSENADYFVDYTTGEVNINPIWDGKATVKAGNGLISVITENTNPFKQGDLVCFGTSTDERFQLKTYTVEAVVTDRQFQIRCTPVLTDVQAYCNYNVQPYEELTAEFQFDYWVRFDNDRIDKGQDEAGFISIDNITLVELKTK